MIDDGSAASARRTRLITELRGAGACGARVLAAIEQTPRDLFVPTELREEAYENTPLPIGNGQTISQPFVVALMTEALGLADGDTVLEIGTGSGYQAAILARLARLVYSIERHRSLLRQAQQRFAALSLGNIICRLGDGAKGWPEEAPFDRIIVTAAAPAIPSALVEQLAKNGILVAPVGEEHRDQRLLRIRRGHDGISTEDLGAVRFVPLVRGGPGNSRVADAGVGMR